MAEAILQAEREGIISSPGRYTQWLSCFEILRSRNIDHDEYALLCRGTCADSEQMIAFYEEQLIVTINAMIKRYISAFQKELNMYTAFGETENIHLPYIHFAQKIKMCMFFRELDFMSLPFREELEASVRTEVQRFWKHACRGLYEACTEHHDEILEDALYVIRHIKLI